ncbi:MAG: hypothetical protein AAGP08_01375 [Pseudomonadota bacterium]
MRRIAFVLALCLSAGQAVALSCKPPTVQEAFAFAHEAAEEYVPVLGRFEGTVPRSEKAPKVDQRYQARFVGVGLTRRGVEIPIDVSVDVHEQCIASWCPSLPSDMELLTFLRRDGAQHFFDIDACWSSAFLQPTTAQVEQMQTCLKHLAC